MGNAQKADQNNDDLIRWMVIWQHLNFTQIKTMPEKNGAIDPDELTSLLNETKAKKKVTSMRYQV